MGLCGPILVVDDDASMRALITTLLTRARFDVCEAATADEALAVADVQLPTVALVDVKLGNGASGYELCHELRERFESIRVVFISGVRTEPFDRVGGLLLGADDYLVKPFDPDELLARVRKLVRQRPKQQSDDDLAAALTPREREVLELLAAGLPQAAIAQSLVLSPKTIGTHIQNVLAKLDVHSRAEAVAVAYRTGVVGSVSAHVFAVADE